jgi:hypothetical protein
MQGRVDLREAPLGVGLKLPQGSSWQSVLVIGCATMVALEHNLFNASLSISLLDWQ